MAVGDWQQLWEAVNGPQPNAPEGALTPREFADKFDIPPNTASVRLKRKAKEGALEVGWKETRDARGHRIVTVCYWPKEEK